MKQEKTFSAAAGRLAITGRTMGSKSESLTLQVATLIQRRGTGNGQWSRRMYRQETSEMQDGPRVDLTLFLRQAADA